MKTRTLFPTLLALALLVRTSLGIIVINPDETECLAAPPDGAPWNYVARLDNKFGPRASGFTSGTAWW